MKIPHKNYLRCRFLATASLLACVQTLILAPDAHTQVVYDFNTPGQLASAFYSAPTQGGMGSQANSGGLSDSGWVPNGSGARGFEVTEATFSPLTSAFSLSIYFKFGGTLEPYVGETAWIGIGRSSDPNVTFDPRGGGTGFLGPESSQMLIAGVGPRTDGNSVRIYYATMVDGVNTNLNQPGSPTASLTIGNWYYLQVDFDLLGTEDGYDFTIELFNSSESGIVSGSALLSHTASAINADLTGGDVHALFGGRNGAAAGALGFDNFAVSAIPEPSVHALALGLCVAMGLLFRKRRRG